MQMRDSALGIVLFLLGELYIHDVTRSTKRDKHYHIVDACQGIPLGGDIGYFNLLQHREFFSFA